MRHPFLGAIGATLLVAAPARAQTVDGTLTCSSSYEDLAFNGASDEDNDCNTYAGSSCDPTPAGQPGPDHIFQFLTGADDAWVELAFEWGWDEDMDF